MKILHFIHSLAGGGAEKQLRLLVNGLDKGQFHTAVFCVNDYGNDVECQKVHFFVAKNKSPYSLAYLKEIWQAIASFNPDIVHVWLPASVAIPAMLFAFLQRKKVIFCYRNRMTFNRGLCYPEFLIALICAHRIISNHEVKDSNAVYRWLYALKKGVVINNAVSVPEQYHKSTFERSEKARFLFIGRLTEQKNPKRLMQAFAILAKKNQAWTLEMYGKGEQESEIQQLINEFGLAEKIFLKGLQIILTEKCKLQIVCYFPRFMRECLMYLSKLFQLACRLLLQI